MYSAITVRTPDYPKTPLEMTPREFSQSILAAAEKINRSLLALDSGISIEKIFYDDVEKEGGRDIEENKYKYEEKEKEEDQGKNHIIEDEKSVLLNEVNAKVKRKDNNSQNDNNEYYSSAFLSEIKPQKKEKIGNENKNILNLNGGSNSSKNNKINNAKHLKNIDHVEISDSSSISTKMNNKRKKENTNYYEIELEIEEEQYQLEQLSVCSNSLSLSPPCVQLSNLVNNKPILNLFNDSLSPNPCLNPALKIESPVDNKKKNNKSKKNKNNDDNNKDNDSKNGNNSDNNKNDNDSSRNDSARLSVLSVDVQTSKRRTSSFDEYPSPTKQTKNNKNNNNNNNNNSNLTDIRNLRRSTSPPKNRGQISGQILGQGMGRILTENQNGFENGNTADGKIGENTDLNYNSVMTPLNLKSTYVRLLLITSLNIDILFLILFIFYHLFFVFSFLY